MGHGDDARQAIEGEREQLLASLDRALEVPMVVLAFCWLALFVVEVVRGLGPFLSVAGWGIWAAFVLEFALGLALAPRKLAYLKSNWLKAVALAAPALRVFRLARLFQAARAARGLRLLRVVSSVNRGMGALGASMQRRGFGYVLGLTFIVTLAGGAGMLAFEPQLGTYGDALWWTAMIMTTMGSETWPASPEGRVLCLLLALYAFGVFGYVTAALASFFVGRDAGAGAGDVASERSVRALREEILALRRELDSRGER